MGSTYPNTVEVEAGSNLIVTLTENPTTGYRWMVIDQDLKARGLFNIVKLSGENYTTSRPADSTFQILGAGGVKTMNFTVTKNCSGYLGLYYARIWEIQSSIEKKENISNQVSIVIPLKTLQFDGQPIQFAEKNEGLQNGEPA